MTRCGSVSKSFGATAGLDRGVSIDGASRLDSRYHRREWGRKSTLMKLLAGVYPPMRAKFASTVTPSVSRIPVRRSRRAYRRCSRN